MGLWKFVGCPNWEVLDGNEFAKGEGFGLGANEPKEGVGFCPPNVELLELMGVMPLDVLNENWLLFPALANPKPVLLLMLKALVDFVGVDIMGLALPIKLRPELGGRVVCFCGEPKFPNPNALVGGVPKAPLGCPNCPELLVL